MNTYSVSSSKDSGTGSLREAIELANENPGKDSIFVEVNVEENQDFVSMIENF